MEPLLLMHSARLLLISFLHRLRRPISTEMGKPILWKASQMVGASIPPTIR